MLTIFGLDLDSILPFFPGVSSRRLYSYIIAILCLAPTPGHAVAQIHQSLDGRSLNHLIRRRLL